MTAHSILTPVHALGSGMTARVVRVLRGTNNSSWGGTMAYRTGIDVLVSLHCRWCCCRAGAAGCTDPVVPEFRVRYDKVDPDDWFRTVSVLAEEHVRAGRHRYPKRPGGEA